ncbi:hypothetical protein CBR_g8742 [Chara braunii]|uniref:Uncharacterized protein n=1 Tax=Chara braunii TaxID=69332 RepID=A0A388KMP3_CHABU|nr:hypothetical protein CBR_g8742 [Chara braunii]|eukprot:GBG71320.1 hypothetical protein CBR_g8742 [Chara braunii]
MQRTTMTHGVTLRRFAGAAVAEIYSMTQRGAGLELRDAGMDRGTLMPWGASTNRGEISTKDVAGGVASELVEVWLLGELGTLGNPPGGSACHIEQFDDAYYEGAPHDQAGLGDHAMESASMRDFMAELEATLPAMMEGESIVARHADGEDVWSQPQVVHMGEPTPDTEEDRMAREAREDEEEAARAKTLADADPRTQVMACDMKAMRQLRTGGAGARGYVVEDVQMEGPIGTAHAQTLDSREVREREGETAGPDIDGTSIVPIPRDGETDAIVVAYDGEACGEIVIDSTVPEVHAAQLAQLGDPGEVPAGDVEDEEAIGSPTAVGGDVETGEDACGEVHGDVCTPSTLLASGVEEGASVMASPPIQQDAPTGTHRQRRRHPPGPGTQCTHYVEQPRGSLMFDTMIVDELGTCLATDLTETRRGVRIDLKKAKTLLPRLQFVSWGPASRTPSSDASMAVGAMGVGAAHSPPRVARDRGTRSSAPTSAVGRPQERRHATAGAVASLLGCTDVSWSNTRRSTTATRKRQLGLGR